MIDTHCHLTFPDFAGRTDRVLEEAAGAGVTGAITISTTTRDCLEALAIARAHDNVWCSSGVHPLYSGGDHAWENLHAVASDPRCVAWGELGLDNHYPDPPADTQRRVLDEQLAFIQRVNHGGPGGIGKPNGLPVVLHCREAFGDLIPILKRTSLPPERFVFHCFTGGPEDMRRLLDFGACVSFTGVLTYPNAADVRRAAAMAPADRVMVETDAPFLPPVPHRGRRPCVPAWVVHTARALAGARGVAFEQLHEQVNLNTERFYGVPARAPAPGREGRGP